MGSRRQGRLTWSLLMQACSLSSGSLLLCPSPQIRPWLFSIEVRENNASWYPYQSQQLWRASGGKDYFFYGHWFIITQLLDGYAELLFISIINSNCFEQFTMLSSNPLEKFMRSDVTLAFRTVVGIWGRGEGNVLEATEPVSSLMPVGASSVVELANKEVYVHDLM